MFLVNRFITKNQNLKAIRPNRRSFHNKHDYKWSTNDIRKKYLDFFCNENKHKFIKSSSVLPKKGSGTYFTNAGMNQFKSIILGESQADKIIDFSKYNGVANSQKCIRIGGKHSDLDDIGKDTYHHTFFEMLGNWSFGNYDKETACKLALELMVDIYKLNINGLYFTYFRGDENLNLEPDLETKNIWLKLGIKNDKILPFGMRENFWEMDVVGPCGPCTEIHYDRNVNNVNYSCRDIDDATKLVNAGTERVIELWNLVFMQYNRTGSKNFTRLPNLVVDTGMGLERLAAVLNDFKSNYDTDLFVPMMDHIYDCTKINGVPNYLECSNNDYSYGYKVLTDHMRSITVAISDGLVPSRNGLGGFLKFLILKNLKICRDVFGVHENASSLLCDLVPIVVETLKEGHPDLLDKIEFVKKVIKNTENVQKQKLNSFSEITERYLKKLNNPKSLNGEQIWKLFKGDGSGEEISTDFIKEYCDTKKINLDLENFDKIYLIENEKALRNVKNSRKENTIYIEMATKLKEMSIKATDNSFRYSFNLDTQNNEAKFFSDGNKLNSNIVAIFTKNENGKYEMTSNLDKDSDCIIVLDKTSFYPESGGQISDNGCLRVVKSNSVVQIDQVYHIQGYSFHIGKLNDGSLNLSDSVECEIDAQKRFEITMNHTGVHLLNHSLRKHFGKENSIIQSNSIVKNSSLKFEFGFNDSLHKPNLNDIRSIEKICIDLINSELPIYINNDVKIEQELKKGKIVYPLRVLKDVLYPLNVRIVTLGDKWENFFIGSKNENNSGELCCGTHATNTKQLNDFVITGLNINGDSTYEIVALTLNKANEARKNDIQVLGYFNEMLELHKEKEKNINSLTPNELNNLMNQIADRSILIESIFKSKPVSYLTLHTVKEESNKYRPSKIKLQDILKKFFEQELCCDLYSAQFATVISSINPKSNINFKFLAFESTLNHHQVLSVLKKIKNIYPVLILFNKYRGNYFFYSTEEIGKNKNLNEYFKKIEKTILSDNINSNLVEENPNYRVLRCSVLNDFGTQRDYFVF